MNQANAHDQDEPLDVPDPWLWVAHCHIADHNQGGMMFGFHVARDPEPAR